MLFRSSWPTYRLIQTRPCTRLKVLNNSDCKVSTSHVLQLHRHIASVNNQLISLESQICWKACMIWSSPDHLKSKNVLCHCYLPTRKHENLVLLPRDILTNTNKPLCRPRNMIGQSQSGTGKTAAFVLTMLSRIDPNLKAPQVRISIHIPYLHVQWSTNDLWNRLFVWPLQESLLDKF